MALWLEVRSVLDERTGFTGRSWVALDRSEHRQGREGGPDAFHDPIKPALFPDDALRRDLQDAVGRQELVVEYQPVVRLRDGVVVGAEALVRWDHPVHGRLGPDRFIPLAEQTSVIRDIGAFVIDDVCAHAARWRDLRPETTFGVAVNVSAAQLVDASLPDRVRDALRRHHLDPASITLELTESMLMDRSIIFERRLAALKAIGVRMAMDDFGSGYSSLGRLKKIPLDVIKIDRSFVTGAAADPENAAIVRSVVDLAAAFGVDVIAEGVETAEDARAALAAGCPEAQGFLWSAAVPPSEIDRLLTRQFDPVPSVASTDDGPERFHAYTDALRTVQHELATPLAVLNCSVAVLDDHGAIERDVHDGIIRSTRRLSRIVEALGMLDDLDRGTLSVAAHADDMVDIVRGAATEVAMQTDRRIEICAPPAVPVRCDGPLVTQAVVNLLTNAVKYSPDRSPVTVRIIEGGASDVTIEVADEGPGVPLHRLGTIWRKFGRLDHSVPGSGIGLYLARGIARAHGGNVRYRAGEPSGSVFCLELPSSSSD